MTYLDNFDLSKINNIHNDELKDIDSLYNHCEISLNKFKDLNKFFKTLEDIDPVSIDSFLRDYREFQEIGKCMIAYEILKCENIKKFLACNDNNWYTHLIHDIKSGCENPENILHNKLTIITFNYDISLEYYLHVKLAEVPFFGEYAKEYISKLPIYHVYGKLYENRILDYGNYFCDETTQFQLKINLFTMKKAVEIYKNIKLIPERNNNLDIKDTAISKAIQNASRIVIIGFGFDKDNLKMLGFPANKTSLVEYLNRKKIQYHDYEGNMNSIYNQFYELKNNTRCEHISIIRSINENLSDSYHYDFRLSLFDN